MDIRFLLYSMLLFWSSLQAQRQSILKTVEDLAGYDKVSQEKVFIHYNATVLLAGEYLYYSLYCLNVHNDHLSDISKVAYVELIDESNKAVFKHKVKLENGLGQGDFFLPVSVPSGNYKLIGYTQWMLNAKKNLLFQGDLSIINPYQVNQKAILAENESDDSIVTSIPLKRIERKNNKKLNVNIDKQILNKRNLVVLTISEAFSGMKKGNYSVSVRKKKHFVSSEPLSSDDFLILDTKSVKNQSKSIKSSVFFPEMRGELIYGRIIPQEPTLPIIDIDVALSVPGRTDDVKIIATDENGSFIFNLDKNYEENNFIIQILGENKNDYKIELSLTPAFSYPNFDFYKFRITEELEDDIIQQSVYNQIENSYFNVKPDTIQKYESSVPFYGSPDETFNLDEYTRFPTVKETIIEVVNNVWTRTNKKGEKVFVIRGNNPTQEDYNFPPLVIVDGIVEQDHEYILEYDARKIQRISFVRDRYFLGTKIFEGILIFETLKGDYVEGLNKGYLLQTTLSRPQATKKYFTQQYDQNDTTYAHIPDYRNQLLWKPNNTTKEDNTILKFFTSDVVGDFEICIEGFTDDGKPISIKEYIKVE
ncbi:hypothetical protein [Aquimarina sp. Aq107]|uniref:hypothetical protein n=1 Tax=Aquimarina sp. Aq107 TaxID=1191912 RepID=UPI00131EEA74|nr:hypothetical protein [Aquimarina sp. Aq107]